MKPIPPPLSFAIDLVISSVALLAFAAFLIGSDCACTSQRHAAVDAAPDACDCVLVDAGQMFGEQGVCVEPVTGKPGLCR